MAASLICFGVSKSGSPCTHADDINSLLLSSPLLWMKLAIVADGFTLLILTLVNNAIDILLHCLESL